MSEMVERVARAMFERHKSSEQTWESLGSFWINTYREKARDAIEAMREPSEAMWRAGSDSIEGYQRLERGHAYAVEAKATWEAMIDEALK